jgi:hypothetical protein
MRKQYRESREVVISCKESVMQDGGEQRRLSHKQTWPDGYISI